MWEASRKGSLISGANGLLKAPPYSRLPSITVLGGRQEVKKAELAGCKQAGHLDGSFQVSTCRANTKCNLAKKGAGNLGYVSSGCDCEGVCR